MNGPSRVTIAVAIAISAVAAGGIAVGMHERSLAPNEAIGVIPITESVRVGTTVWGPPGGRPIGQVARVRQRGDELVIRIRFNGDSGVVRRRGDGLSFLWTGLDKRRLNFTPAPTYEKTGRVSDTLFVLTRLRPPGTVEELLGTLYRGRPTLDSPPR